MQLLCATVLNDSKVIIRTRVHAVYLSHIIISIMHGSSSSTKWNFELLTLSSNYSWIFSLLLLLLGLVKKKNAAGFICHGIIDWKIRREKKFYFQALGAQGKVMSRMKSIYVQVPWPIEQKMRDKTDEQSPRTGKFVKGFVSRIRYLFSNNKHLH